MKSLSWGITQQRSTPNAQRPTSNTSGPRETHRSGREAHALPSVSLDKADVATAFDVADPDIVEFLRFHGETQVFLNIVFRNVIASHRAQNEIAIFPDHFWPTFDEKCRTNVSNKR
jgi:hypothetical protein